MYKESISQPFIFLPYAFYFFQTLNFCFVLGYS